MPNSVRVTNAAVECVAAVSLQNSWSHKRLCPTLTSYRDPIQRKTFSSFQLVFPHLKQPSDEDCEANGLHDVGVVLQQCLATPFHPQVQLLRLVLIVEMGRVVGDLLLDAGPG